MLDRRRTVRAIEIARAESDAPRQMEPYPSIRPLVIGIRIEREQLRQRITARLQDRLDGGLIEEVQRLHDTGIPWDRLDYYGLEYRFVGAFLRGGMSRTAMQQRLNSAIHDFAKRQCTWFRHMEKGGVPLHWVDGSADTLGETMKIIRASCSAGA
ncbi:MAG: tRNA dimethylallyltransferase [Verrucomicrobiota bacterium]